MIGSRSNWTLPAGGPFMTGAPIIMEPECPEAVETGR